MYIILFALLLVITIISLPLFFRGREYHDDVIEYSVEKEIEFARRRFDIEKKQAEEVEYTPSTYNKH